MDQGIPIKPPKDLFHTLSDDHRHDKPYTLEINGTNVNIRFAGTDSLNHRLAGAFTTMLS